MSQLRPHNWIYVAASGGQLQSPLPVAATSTDPPVGRVDFGREVALHRDCSGKVNF